MSVDEHLAAMKAALSATYGPPDLDAATLRKLSRTELLRVLDEFRSERDAAKRSALRAFEERDIEIDRSKVVAERVEKLHKACEAANAAIDDWRCMYAWTECDRADVTAAAGRILDNGGALAYAASVQKLIRAALATPSAAKGSK